MSTAEHQPGPLAQADPDDEHHPGPLEQAARPQTTQRVARPKKKWLEKRWERRRRRRFTEEVLGWVLVPLILLAVFWAIRGTLNAFGTDFTQLIQGIRVAISGAGRG